MGKRLLFGLLTAFFVLTALEGGARIFGPGIMPADPGRESGNGLPEDPLTGWRINPGTQQDFGVPKPTHVNQYGLRSPEFPLQKASGEERILLLGDSTVYGVLVSDQDSFGGVLQTLLSAGNPAVRVMNAGCPGYSSWQALQALRERLLPLQPNVVVIATLWSDAQGSEAPDSARYGDGKGRSLLSHSAFYVWLQAKLRRAKWEDQTAEEIEFRFQPRGRSLGGAPPPPGAPPEIGPTKLAPTHRVPLAQYRENLRALAQLSREAGAQPVFLILPCYRDPALGKVGDFRDAYREAMVEVAAEIEAPLVDSSTAFFGGSVNALFYDDVHPTPKGHKLIADALYSQLKK